MSPIAAFEFTLLLLVAVLGLELLAKVLRLPPAAALIAGGIVLAFVPGFPTVSLDPELVLVLFLPPLLMDGAYFTAWADFRRNLGVPPSSLHCFCCLLALRLISQGTSSPIGSKALRCPAPKEYGLPPTPYAARPREIVKPPITRRMGAATGSRLRVSASRYHPIRFYNVLITRLVAPSPACATSMGIRWCTVSSDPPNPKGNTAAIAAR